MMEKNFYYLIDACEDRIGMLSEAISLGNCTSYEEYKFACGQIRGLEAACAIIQDLISNLETADD
jgi:hypothetical protein